MKQCIRLSAIKSLYYAQRSHNCFKEPLLYFKDIILNYFKETLFIFTFIYYLIKIREKVSTEGGSLEAKIELWIYNAIPFFPRAEFLLP